MATTNGQFALELRNLAKAFDRPAVAGLDLRVRIGEFYILAVARGEQPAPADAAKPSFNSVEAVVRLLTPENRALLATIRDKKPQSVAELVQMSGRSQPNLTRTLAKLEAAGFITMKSPGRRKAPSVAVRKIVVEIDPYSDRGVAMDSSGRFYYTVG